MYWPSAIVSHNSEPAQLSPLIWLGCKIGSVYASHPAAMGSNLETAKKFQIICFKGVVHQKKLSQKVSFQFSGENQTISFLMSLLSA